MYILVYIHLCIYLYECVYTRILFCPCIWERCFTVKSRWPERQVWRTFLRHRLIFGSGRSVEEIRRIQLEASVAEAADGCESVVPRPNHDQPKWIFVC